MPDELRLSRRRLLYFPGEPENDRDGIFSPDLLLSGVRDTAGTRRGSFTFVLEA
jgi:hypothetical protein